MSVGGEPLGQVAVPTLGSPDRVRIDAVVDQTDPHGWPKPSLQSVEQEKACVYVIGNA